MQDIEICGYVPGAIGRVAELHGVYYHQHWNFGLYFEAKVASELSEFLSRMDPALDRFWVVRRDHRVEGSITIDGSENQKEGAHLRWFILSPEIHGLGIGDKLMREAIAFCREQGIDRIYLWTFQGLDAARRLYEKHGFQLTEQFKGLQWGTEVVEQKFVLNIPSNPAG
ncbi:MAG: GNAT family N-acetyltransferase [Anaerolineales bacterium]|nr:GNAT family N-acetyltransferase [Anaerolineales bacterium]